MKTMKTGARGSLRRQDLGAGILVMLACGAAVAASFACFIEEEAVASAGTRGLAPLSGDREVPPEWMPPGSNASPIPSDEIFPPQTITIRFDHSKHVEGIGMSCKTCHAQAYASLEAKDRLLPDPTQTCDSCHETDHADLGKVKPGPTAIGECGFCHLGEGAGQGGQVARMVIPDPNLRFPHKKHLDRNVQCGQCHGRIEEMELATRDQLPRMAGCFTCHQMSGAAQGDAKSDCETCHLTNPGGKLAVQFGSGMLVPPSWLHNAGRRGTAGRRSRCSA